MTADADDPGDLVVGQFGPGTGTPPCLLSGRPIKLLFQDGGSDEPTAINAFQNLINVAKVVEIMGRSLSQQAFAADPFAVRAKVPVIGPSQHPQGHSADRRVRLARVGPRGHRRPQRREGRDRDQQGPEEGRRPVRAERRVQQVGDRDVQQAVKDLKLDLATVQTFQTTDTDFTAQITKVLNVPAYSRAERKTSMP